MLARLATFASDRGAAGAGAAVLRLQLEGTRGAEEPKQKQLLAAVLAHPGLTSALKSGEAAAVFDAIRDIGRVAVWQHAADDILILGELLFPDLSPRVALGLDGYWEVLSYLVPDTGTRERIRERLVALGRAALKHEGFTKSEREYVAGIVAYLDGAAARGKLVGHPAPPLDFLWSSRNELTSLADLKGKVVVLDFWATWCGACVASIPKIRELQKHYEGCPVVIVGVTSLQGTHVGPDGAVATKGDPEKEFRLMAEYRKQKRITWDVVFSKQDVYNPDYGVRGIPHMILLDPRGRVAAGGLHPGRPLAEKTAKIDALLRRYRLPTPKK